MKEVAGQLWHSETSGTGLPEGVSKIKSVPALRLLARIAREIGAARMGIFLQRTCEKWCFEKKSSEDDFNSVRQNSSATSRCNRVAAAAAARDGHRSLGKINLALKKLLFFFSKIKSAGYPSHHFFFCYVFFSTTDRPF